MRQDVPIILAAPLLLLWTALGAASPFPCDDPVAARAGEEELAMGELHELLLLRHAFSLDGRDILRHMVQRVLIEHIAEERGVTVLPREVNALWDELDRRAKIAGQPGGMAAELERARVDAEEFRELLRLSIVQEKLTREALGLPENAPISGQQRDIWIDQEIQQRGLELLSPPWKDGAVAHCGGAVVRVESFATLLANHLPSSEVREACYHLLLLRGVEVRMPDLAPEARAKAIEAELERRRQEAESEVTGGVLKFEELLNAQGLTLESIRRDPALGIAALSTLWVDRKYGDEGLREAFEKERTFFEDRYGRAVLTHAIFLRAAKFLNPWNPRTFEQAEEEMRAMSERIEDLEDFVALAQARSEDPRSKAQDGALGWVARGDEGVPPSIREGIFDFFDSGGEIAEGGRLIGPLRLDNGCVMLWLSGLRDSPGWEEMRSNVHKELRRRFLRDVLPEDRVHTFLDQ